MKSAVLLRLALVSFAGSMMMGVSSCSNTQIRTGDPNVDQVMGMLQAAMPVAEGLLPIGYEEERLIGKQMAQELVRRYGGLVDNPSLVTYINLVGTSVAVESDRPEIPYYFGILNSESVNAFACPGGYVFITTGALRKIRSEAELAGVLGHEIAHVTKKHILNTIRRAKVLKGASRLSAQTLRSDVAMLADLMNVGLDTLLNKGLSREEEIEADTAGTQFTSYLGYQPQGLSIFVRTLSELRKSSGAEKSNLSVFFSTHPSPQDRLETLQGVLASLDPSLNQRGKWLVTRFQARAAGYF